MAKEYAVAAYGVQDDLYLSNLVGQQVKSDTPQMKWLAW